MANTQYFLQRKTNATGAEPTVIEDSSFFDTFIAGSAKGVRLPTTATSPLAIPSAAFFFEASQLSGTYTDGQNITAATVDQIAAYTITPNAANYPKFKTSGQNGLPYVNFPVTSAVTLTGAMSTNFALSSFTGLNANFAFLAVVRINKYTPAGAQSDWMGWKDAGSGEWMTLGVNGNELYQFADRADSFPVVSAAQPPMRPGGFAVVFGFTNAGIRYIYVNGVEAESQAQAVGTSAIGGTSTFSIGAVAGAGFCDLAAVAVFNNTVTLNQLQAASQYFMQRYGVANPSQPFVTAINGNNSTGYTATGPLVVIGPYGYGTGPANWCNDLNGFQDGGKGPTAATFWGALVAIGGAPNNGGPPDEHQLIVNAQAGNVLAVWNQNPGGFSTISHMQPGGSNGVPANGGGGGGPSSGNVGYAGTGTQPWGSPGRGSMFLEAFSGNGSFYADLRIVQTAGSTPNLKGNLRYDTQAWEFYDNTNPGTAAANAAMPGLTFRTGAPAVATANNATYNTNIPLPNTGFCVAKDTTGNFVAMYKISGTTITVVIADTEFSNPPVQGTPLTLNAYNNSGQIGIENKTGGSLNLTASFLG